VEVTLPRPLQSELDDLRVQFGRLDVQVTDGIVLIELPVRGVTVRAIVSVSSYPEQPPLISVEGGWKHHNVLKDGRVSGLACQEHWNRTFGIALAVRELSQRFVEDPPRR
jgi:hypothetical protein